MGMLRRTKTLQTLSVGDSSLGDEACLLFQGLAENVSITSLDLEHKGLTAKAGCALAETLLARQARPGAAPMASLLLSRNPNLAGAPLLELAKTSAPRVLKLCEGSLRAKDGEALGRWAAQGVEELDLRDNSMFG